jgi:hypothetical protein
MSRSAVPCFFVRSEDGFVPDELGRSPWNPDAALSGVATAGLLASVLEDAYPTEGMNVARLTVDILGLVPRRLLTVRASVLRQGRQIQLLAAELIVEAQCVARASLLRIRAAETEVSEEPSPYPRPEDVPDGKFLRSETSSYVRTKPIRGNMRERGRGIFWAAYDAEMIAGTPMSPSVRAAMFADLGSGCGSPFSPSEWSYANVDISLHFKRLPRGEWLLLDALSESAGNGLAVCNSVFADPDGIYAWGHQTLFIGPSVLKR